MTLGDVRHDALVGLRMRNVVELFSLDLFYGHLGGPGQLAQGPESRLVAQAAGEDQASDGPAGAERFQDGVTTVDQVGRFVRDGGPPPLPLPARGRENKAFPQGGNPAYGEIT